MNKSRSAVAVMGCVTVLLAGGCAVARVDFSGMERPPRAAELDAYDVFVGSWTWEAEMLNAQEPDRSWSGTAKWHWALDRRCLVGEISSKSERTDFTASGIWSWHPTQKKYIWTMYNNWGYPQQGKATYDADTKTWDMRYQSIGLDGTTSLGKYRMRIIDHDTLEWSVTEWSPLYLVKKMEMRGTYKRQR